jgi:uncharacterized protein YkwD
VASTGLRRRAVALGSVMPVALSLGLLITLPSAANAATQAAASDAPSTRASSSKTVVKFKGNTCGSSIKVTFKGVKGPAKRAKKRVTLSAGDPSNRLRVKLRTGTYKVKFPASVANGACQSFASATKKTLVVTRGKRAKVSVTYSAGQNVAPPGATRAAEVLALTNQARSKSRVCGSTTYPRANPLTANSRLQSAAQAHSKDMAKKNYFDHTNLRGQSPFDRMEAAGYNYRAAGENIAAGQPTPAAVVQAWLDSPGHCRNMMNAGFTELGVGVATGGRYGIYWTQNFGAPF